jgi:hypothetical protein
MAKIEQDGIYRVGDKVTGSQFQFRKGAEIGDMEVERVGDWPDDAKAESAPENKAVKAAPENKAAAKEEGK